MGTVIAAEDVMKEGTSGDGDTNAGREFSAGESGGEYGRTMLEVH